MNRAVLINENFIVSEIVTDYLTIIGKKIPKNIIIIQSDSAQLGDYYDPIEEVFYKEKNDSMIQSYAELIRLKEYEKYIFKIAKINPIDFYSEVKKIKKLRDELRKALRSS